MYIVMPLFKFCNSKVYITFLGTGGLNLISLFYAPNNWKDIMQQRTEVAGAISPAIKC